jgi:hypothetical protein
VQERTIPAALNFYLFELLNQPERRSLNVINVQGTLANTFHACILPVFKIQKHSRLDDWLLPIMGSVVGMNQSPGTAFVFTKENQHFIDKVIVFYAHHCGGLQTVDVL